MRFGRTDNLAGRVEELELQLTTCQEDNLQAHEADAWHLQQLLEIRELCDRKRRGGDGRVSIAALYAILNKELPVYD